MIDPELKKEFDRLNNHLDALNKGVRPPVWRSFITGALSGLGSVVGVAIALTLIGWILNSIGVIPAFKNQVTHLQQDLDYLRRSR